MDKLLQGFIQALENVVTKDEFLKAFEPIVTKVQEVERRINARLAELKDGYTPQKGVDYFDGEPGKSPTTDEIRALIKPLIPEVQDGHTPTEEELTSLIKPLIPEPIPGSPDMADDIRNKLELLQGDERLDASAIKGLKDYDKDITELKARRVQTPAKAYMIHVKDVSSQCDGANKTFTVGGTHFGINGVFGTQHPIIYRPIIDYTITRTGIALTDAVAAPESGQSLVIQYLK